MLAGELVRLRPLDVAEPSIADGQIVLPFSVSRVPCGQLLPNRQ